MKTLYLECGMGAAGDMLTAALLELMPDPDAVVAELNGLGIPGVQFSKEAMSKCGIGGTHMTVRVHGEEESEEMFHHHHEHHDYSHEHEHAHEHTHKHEDHEHAHEHSHEHTHEHGDDGHTHHHHSSLHDIEHIVCGHLNIPDQVKQDVMAVYGLIAEAESHAHGVPVTEIHFHEVGTMDAIADITAVCLLMNKIAPDQVIVSPVHVGALLKHFATRFGDMPVMRTEAIGYGMGKKDFEQANCIRAMLGETEDAGDSVLQLECNVDDMTAEELGFAMETILEAGALEVYTVAAGMKKSRPGTILCVLCHEDAKETLVRVIFRNTTTIGVREHRCSRYTLKRSFETVQTPYGDVQKKLSSGYGVTREKYEYEDLARIAREQGLSLAEVRKSI